MSDVAHPAAARRPIASEPGLGVIIGADSLRGRRSGVGRMTLEIIEAVRRREEISGLMLMLNGRLETADAVLARIAAAPEHEPLGSAIETPVVSLEIVRHAKLLVRNVPGVQRLRALKRRLAQRPLMAEIRRAGGGRAVYHEPNMIPQSYDNVTVTTFNDLSWHHHPDYHPAERIDWINRHIRRALAESTRFVAISHFTAAAMVRELGVDRGKIDVVPLAAGTQFAPMAAEDAAPALATLGLQDRGYVLSVSTLEPRKNFDRLMAAHLALPDAVRRRFPLVIVGGSGWGATLDSTGAERARRDGTLRLLGHVADADLVALYARAAAFAYVSIYEGFGLPVIEAMAAGSPVIASSTTATGETAGNAAVLVDPLDVEAIAAGLRGVLEDEAHAADLVARGLAHAATFTWDRTATELIRCWRRAAG